MKILYVIPSLDRNGPVNMCFELISAITEEYKNIKISVLALGDGERLHDFKAITDLTICERRDIESIKMVLNGDYDIVHSHCFVSDFYSFIFCKNTHRFTTLHNCFDDDFIDRKGFLIGKFQSFIAKNIIREFYKIGCSKTVFEYYKKNVNNFRLSFVRNGSGSKVDSFNLTNKMQETLNLFYVGSFIPRKNVKFILENFSIWAIEKNVNLHLFGTGDLFDELNLKYTRNNIKFYGHVSDIRNHIKKFDCIISASKSEGLPMAILEAMSLSKTYICSDIPSHKEIYESNFGMTGLLFKENDSKDFLECLDKIYMYYNEWNSYRVLCKNSLDSFNNNYTSNSMMENYMKFYNSVIDNGMMETK